MNRIVTKLNSAAGLYIFLNLITTFRYQISLIFAANVVFLCLEVLSSNLVLGAGYYDRSLS